MRIRMLFFPIELFKDEPFIPAVYFGFWMVLTLKGRKKPFCFQTIKT